MGRYFDYAAATPLDTAVLAAMTPYLTDSFYNPSATYKAAASARAALEAARARCGAVLGARPSEIIFTAGGTEANNLAIHGIMAQYPEANVIVSAVEHESVLEPAAQFERRLAPVLPDGRIDLEALKNLIDDNTVLVSIMYANNETGTIQPLNEVATLIQNVRTGRRASSLKGAAGSPAQGRPLYFHTDACQAANYLTLQVSRLGVDLLTLNAGKIYGPKQTGLLYVKHGVVLAPLVHGGGQERSLRSGTENVANFIGMAQALEIAQNMREAESRRLTELRDKCITMVQAALPDVTVTGSRAHRLPNNIHFTLPGQDNERLMYALDEQGFMVATGSACSASDDEPSHVLQALGLSDEAAESSLRITLGRQTTEADVAELAEALQTLCLGIG